MGNEQSAAPKPKALNPSELQTYLMVTKVKLNQSRNKKIAIIKKKESEIIKHLSDNNLDIAKAKMEGLMREEDLITVYDIIGPLCEILKEKVTYIMTSKECPADLRASLDTLIYSSNRLEIEELHFIREFIKQKYNNIYVDKANSNIDKLVNMNVVERLTVKPAAEAELIERLKAICEREEIQFSFPQLSNPLLVDTGMSSGNNAFIPNMQNFNESAGNNFDNGNRNNHINSNVPFANNFQQQQQMQGNYSMTGQSQFPGQYTGNMNSNANNAYSNMQNMQNLDNPNYNPYESSGLNFNNVPNNFSNNNQNQQATNYPPSQFPINNNNQINPNVNNFNNNDNNNFNYSSGSGFPSMPTANNNFPQQGKSDNLPMMSGGFAPMGNISAGQQNNSQTFPTMNNPNFNNVDDLDFPSKK
jgi:vacuolar protein sorting-associated protein IST1